MVDFFHEAQISLVVFTLLSQIVVGAIWIVTVGEFLTSLPAFRQRLGRLVTWTGVPVLGLALAFSTTHLGRPLYAWRALRALGTSWVSREIWAFSILFGLLCLYAYLWYRDERGARYRRPVAVLTSVAGVLGIITQSQLYMIPGRPQWNHFSTILLFGATAMMLGALLVGVITTLIAHREAPLRAMYQHLAASLLGAAALYGIGFIARIIYLAQGQDAAGVILGGAATGAETVGTALTVGWTIVGANPFLSSMELLLAVAVPLVAGLTLVTICWHKGSIKLANRLIHSTLGLVFVGTLAGRVIFYLTGKPWF